MATRDDAFREEARRKLYPKLKESAIFLTIATDDPDPKFCLELGAAIMFDKPIISVIRKGIRVPDHLRRVSDRIVYGDMEDKDFADKLQQAVNEVAARGWFPA